VPSFQPWLLFIYANTSHCPCLTLSLTNSLAFSLLKSFQMSTGECVLRILSTYAYFISLGTPLAWIAGENSIFDSQGSIWLTLTIKSSAPSWAVCSVESCKQTKPYQQFFLDFRTIILSPQSLNFVPLQQEWKLWLQPSFACFDLHDYTATA